MPNSGTFDFISPLPIRLTAASFDMAYQDDSNLYLDTDCQHNPVTQGFAKSEDYFFVPEAETADGLRGSKFCGTSAANQIIACKYNFY